MRKILITGGKGYVGGRICEHLALSSDNIVVATSRNSEDTLQLKNVVIKAIDYQNDDFEPLLEGVDTVVHLASLNEIECLSHPFVAIDVNIKITYKWISAAEKAGVRKFIYFSTIHVYESGISGEITELERTLPTHPYGITHRAAEDYILRSRLTTNMDAIVLRMSNSFGRPASASVNRWTLLVNDLCKNVINTNELKLSSNGLQCRDFICLTDVVRAVEHVIELEKSDTQDGLFNLCSGHTISVYDMTNIIAENFELMYNIKPQIKRMKSGKVNIADFKYSIDKLTNTGFNVENKIDREIQDMLIFCQQNFKNQ